MSLPKTFWQWRLYGAGLENLRLEEVELRHPGAGEVLARIDACGICFSDVKIVRLGGEHPRLRGRDLSRHPVVMGHEICCTIVEAGGDVADRFPIGSRWTVQADVFHRGAGQAVGYALEGGFGEYALFGEPVLNGDEGCYLIPVADRVSDEAAALIEPWACVAAALRIEPRIAPKEGGKMAIVCTESPQADYAFSGLTSPVFYSGPAGGVRFEAPAIPVDNWQHHSPFDDIVLFGNLPDEAIIEAQSLLNRGGVLTIVRHGAASGQLDLGRIHYDGITVCATTNWDAREAYRRNRPSRLTPGGRLLLFGAGGPMGRMFAEQALSFDRPPALICAVDRHPDRLRALKEFVGDRASLRLIDTGDADWIEQARSLTAGAGYDEIVYLSSSPDSIADAWSLIGSDGVLNLFAGLPKGQLADFDLTPMLARHARILGSSGSTVADMTEVARLTEAGRLCPEKMAAAAGGLAAVKEGIMATAERRYPGKIVIYPQQRNRPLR